MTNVYEGFSDWKDVAENFSGVYEFSKEHEKLGALAAIPEPDEVLAARYEQESYDGDAWVVFRRGSKYYEVNGGHCSCYGLEDQWQPEEYESAELLLAALEKGNWYGAKKLSVEAVKAALRAKIAA